MTAKERFESAKEIYASYGVDVEAAIEKCMEAPVALHCWQGDDVTGFDHDGPLTGGIQTTGNYPGKAKTPEELMQDMDKALSLMPGKKKLNLHACYAIFEPGEFVDRDRIEPKHFAKWVAFAKERNMGIDFNPTFFSHDKVKDGLTLSSPDEGTRKFWIDHGKACIRISQYFAEETGMPCVMNIWTGDGYKDIPADRMGPRMRYKEAIEEILSEPFDRDKVKPCVESKVFGIGVEAYTVGSAEFTLSFAATHEGCLPLMDNGHYTLPRWCRTRFPRCCASIRRLPCISQGPSAGTATMWCSLTTRRKRWPRRLSDATAWTGCTWRWTTSMPASTAYPPGPWASAAGRRHC